MEKDNERFKILLDATYEWPSEYPFKFIVLSEQVDELKILLNNAEVTEKASKNGKYISVTLYMKLSSSDEVLYVYEKVKQIKGIISL